MQANQPEGYDSAMGFLNKPGASHEYPKLDLNAMKGYGKGTMGQANNTVLGGGSVMGRVQGFSSETHGLNRIVSQGVEFQGSFTGKQVPNSGSSPALVSTKMKVENSKIMQKGKSMIFHG